METSFDNHTLYETDVHNAFSLYKVWSEDNRNGEKGGLVGVISGFDFRTNHLNNTHTTTNKYYG